MKIISDNVPQQINRPNILFVVALFAKFYYFTQPDPLVKVKKSAYNSTAITPEIKMAQLKDRVDEST